MIKNLIMNSFFQAFLLCVVLTPASTMAEVCPLSNFADDYLRAREGGTKLAMFDCYNSAIVSMDRARELQSEVIAALESSSKRVGYKVAAQDPVSQKILGIDAPLFGVFFEGAILPNGSTISIDDVFVAIAEADFAVTVADEGINEATTLAEIARHLYEVVAFIEVPSPVWDSTTSPHGPLMQAANVVARWGIVGDSIKVSADPVFLRSLETMRVTMRNSNGEIVRQETGDFLGGNPLHGVFSAVLQAKRRGERLKKGDLISLGAYGRHYYVPSPGIYEVTYEGVGGETLRVQAHYE